MDRTTKKDKSYFDLYEEEKDDLVIADWYEKAKLYENLTEQIGCPLEKAVKMLVEFQERFGTDVVDYDVGDLTRTAEIVTFDGEEIYCDNEEQQKKLIDLIHTLGCIKNNESE